MPLADGQNYAGYTILRELGAGGMGIVYLAQHQRLPRHDALKVLPAAHTVSDEYRHRFNREAVSPPNCGIRISFISLKSTIAESWTADCGSRWIT